MLQSAVGRRYDDIQVACWLQGEILQLSEKYVRSLARDTQNVVDGPYAGRLTGYGMFTHLCPPLCGRDHKAVLLSVRQSVYSLGRCIGGEHIASLPCC